jgi:hypothetical protein
VCRQCVYTPAMQGAELLLGSRTPECGVTLIVCTAAVCGDVDCRQAVAAAEAYIQQHGLDDVQVEVETRTLGELQEVRAVEGQGPASADTFTCGPLSKQTSCSSPCCCSHPSDCGWHPTAAECTLARQCCACLLAITSVADHPCVCAPLLPLCPACCSPCCHCSCWRWWLPAPHMSLV